jgi:hypothetical protein
MQFVNWLRVPRYSGTTMTEDARLSQLSVANRLSVAAMDLAITGAPTSLVSAVCEAAEALSGRSIARKGASKTPRLPLQSWVAGTAQRHRVSRLGPRTSGLRSIPADGSIPGEPDHGTIEIRVGWDRFAQDRGGEFGALLGPEAPATFSEGARFEGPGTRARPTLCQ